MLRRTRWKSILFLIVYCTLVGEMVLRADRVDRYSRCASAGRETTPEGVIDVPNPAAIAHCIVDALGFAERQGPSLPNDPNPTGFYLSGGTLFYLALDVQNPLALNITYTNSRGTFSAAALCLGMPGLGGISQTCTGTKTEGGGASTETDETTATAVFDDAGKLTKASLVYKRTTPPPPCPIPLPPFCPQTPPNVNTTVLLNVDDPLKLSQPATPSAYASSVSAGLVSTATGGLRAGPFTDLALGGPLPIVFRRSYDSRLASVTAATPLGGNWSSNFDQILTLNGNIVVVALEGGGTVSFQLKDGVYSTLFPPRLPFQLVKTAASYRFLHPGNNLIYTFDAVGRLVKIEDRNGNALTIVPGGHFPAQVADGLGRSVSLSYEPAGARMVLSSVQDQTGRTITYTHDLGGNLTSVADAHQNITSYSYSGSTYAGSLMISAKFPRGNTPRTQAFDSSTGSVLTEMDAAGNKTTLSYVKAGVPGVTVSTDPLAHATTFTHSDPALHDVTSLVDAAGNTSKYAYDSLDRPITFIDRLGAKASITYDPASGYPASFTDAEGNTTSFGYQAQAQGDFTFYNLTTIAYPDGTLESFGYDDHGNVTRATDRAGKNSSFAYNSSGQIVSAINPAGGTTILTYNADGTLATTKDPSGNATTYSYDSLKRLAKVQFADGSSRSFSRDAGDRILSITDERGKISKLAYDANGSIQSTTDALSNTAIYSYNSNDLRTSATDRLGNATRYEYDALGSIASITNPAGEKTAFAYDNLNRLQSVIDPAGKGPVFGRDAEGRLTSIMDAVGNTTTAKLDRNGRLTQLTTPLGEATAFSFDAMDRITSSTDAMGDRRTFSYDSRGLPLALTAPGGITTTFNWGALSVVESVTDPNGGVWSFAHDNQGRMSAATDPLGNSVKFGYDSRSRISSITSPRDSIHFTRDPHGNITQANYSDGLTHTYSYDDENRLIGGTSFSFLRDADGRLTRSNGLTIGRDAAGRITTITYAPQKAVTYTYDPRGLLASVKDWAGGSVSFTFDDAHRLISVSRSNGIVTTYTYDKDSRVASIAEKSGNNTLSSIVLTRDAVGRVSSAVRAIPLEGAVPSTTSLSMTFDAADQIVGATYDSRGRLTSDDVGGTYQWDAASRLMSYSRPDGTASATYDGLGRRIAKTDRSGASVNYVINYATEIPSIATVRSADADLRYYIYTPEGLLLYSVDARTGSHRFYAFDENGSTTFLTNDSGTITDTYGISPNGEIVTTGLNNTTENPFTWLGQSGVWQEPGTKLYYTGSHYYDGVTQQLLSRRSLLSPTLMDVNPYMYTPKQASCAENSDPLEWRIPTSSLHPPNVDDSVDSRLDFRLKLPEISSPPSCARSVR